MLARLRLTRGDEIAKESASPLRWRQRKRVTAAIQLQIAEQPDAQAGYCSARTFHGGTNGRSNAVPAF